MKGIKLCGECADYDKKKHRCKRGANREDEPRNTFYDDCPLPDVAPVVRCKDCKHYSCLGSCLLHSEIADEYSTGFDFRMDDNDFCSYGERKEV